MQWWNLKQLKSTNANSRLSAVEKLGREGETTLVGPLAELLSDSDNKVRAATARALGRIERECAAPPLAARLPVDPDMEVRRAIVKALQQIKSDTAASALVEALSDPAGEVGWQAAQTLKALHWEPADDTELAAFYLATSHFDAAIALGPAAITPLIRVAHGTSFHRSIRAVEALARVGGAQAVRPILDCLGSNDFTVRSAAATALGEIGDGRALEPLICALRDSQHQVCLAACISLGKVGDERAVEPLIRALQHDAPDVRTAAVETLGRLRNKQAVPSLIGALLDDDPDVREGAAKALGLIGDEEAIEQLVVTLTDPQTTVRQAAAAALCRIQPCWERTEGAIRAIPSLQGALKSTEYWVRHCAADVLKKLGLTSEGEGPLLTHSDGARKKRLAAQAVLFAMLADRDRAFRQAAAETLGRLGLPDSVSGLVECLGDTDRGVKTAAARSLEMLRWQSDNRPNKARQLVAMERWADAAALGDHAVDALVDTFSWPDPVARRRATEALVHIGSAYAISALRDLASNPTPEIRDEALAALGALRTSTHHSSPSGASLSRT